jgi:hypothetical protein
MLPLYHKCAINDGVSLQGRFAMILPHIMAYNAEFFTAPLAAIIPIHLQMQLALLCHHGVLGGLGDV